MVFREARSGAFFASEAPYSGDGPGAGLAGEKAAGAVGFGGVEDLGGWALLDDTAGVHEDDFGGSGTGEIHVGRYDNHGDVLAARRRMTAPTSPVVFGSSAGELVEELDGGLHGEGSGDGGGGWEFAHDARCEGDVFPDAQVGEEVKLLKNHAEVGAAGERGNLF